MGDLIVIYRRTICGPRCQPLLVILIVVIVVVVARVLIDLLFDLIFRITIERLFLVSSLWLLRLLLGFWRLLDICNRYRIAMLDDF
jgi:hypothetical protein